MPEPDLEDWKAWRTLLASQELGRFEDSASAMCIERGNNYGTVSSSLIALASPEMRQKITAGPVAIRPWPAKSDRI